MRPLVIPVFLACLLGLSCFSTIAPERDGGSGGSGGPTVSGPATIYGKVLLFRAEGQWEPWVSSVRVVWRASDGRELHEVAVKSNHSGIYRATWTHKDIAQVEVAVLVCEYDSNNPPPRFTCCLDPVPCPGGCDSPWDTAYFHKVGPGGTAYQDLKVYCDATPDVTR